MHINNCIRNGCRTWRSKFFQKLVSFLRLFPSLYGDGGSGRSLQVEIRSAIIFLTAKAGQKASSQGQEIFCVIMPAGLWRYDWLNFWLLPAHTCLNINLRRENVLKNCAYWKCVRLADKVWGWEVEGLITHRQKKQNRRPEHRHKKQNWRCTFPFYKPPLCGKSCVGVLSYDFSGIAGLGLWAFTSQWLAVLGALQINNQISAECVKLWFFQLLDISEYKQILHVFFLGNPV